MTDIRSSDIRWALMGDKTISSSSSSCMVWFREAAKYGWINWNLKKKTNDDYYNADKHVDNNNNNNNKNKQQPTSEPKKHSKHTKHSEYRE